MNHTNSHRICEDFNKLVWHDSKLRSFRVSRREDTEEVVLEVELIGTPGTELSPATVTLEDAVFFLSDIDLQGKRECSDDISNAKCEQNSELIAKIQNERLQFSPDALKGYCHFSFYLIPPGGKIDVIAGNFRVELNAGASE